MAHSLVRLGGLWLGVVGAVVLLAGAGCALAGLGSLGEPTIAENPFRDIPKFLLAFGLASLAVGVLHVVASVGIANRRGWGRWLGLLIALVVLGLLLTPAGRGDLKDLGHVVWLVPCLGYGLTALGLLVWYPSEMLVAAATPAPAPEAGSAAGSPGAPRPSNREELRSSGLPIPGARFAYAEAAVGRPLVAEETIRQARSLVEREASGGHVLVEAVWQDPRYSSLGLAFGEPGVAYARRWPDGDDVKDLVVPSGWRHS